MTGRGPTVLRHRRIGTLGNHGQAKAQQFNQPGRADARRLFCTLARALASRSNIVAAHGVWAGGNIDGVASFCALAGGIFAVRLW